MIINAVNPYQNLSLFNTLQSANLDLSEKSNILNLQNESNSSSFNPNAKSYASEFGFRIDERGFFDKELNQIANLPESYAINIKSIRGIAKELMKQEQSINYNRMDLPYMLNRYYSSLKSLNAEFQTQENENLSRNIISGLTQAYSTNNGDFLGEINRIYQNKEELDRAKTQNKSLNTLMLDNKIVDFGFDKALTNTSNNEILKPYLTREGAVSKSGLLVNFIYQDLKEKNESQLQFFMKPASLDLNSHKKLYEILDGKENIEDFLKENNEQRMSFDLYLYVNGVDKNTTSQDKLSVFFQQYINYEKDLDLREFTNSSSIFELYTQKIKQEFEEIKQDYKAQNYDKERLEDANLKRDSSIENFLNRRQRQMSLNKILNAYLNVMS
ncbi:hypothetical protein [Campylobacter cuniculorum]|uniref:hypothetical protein n=1 Tax=Campylobacter cuniculorum TaxID=374106 RepID=UPI0023F520F7|nr:hypothetical protein [Campylobacter cuniculorum]